MTSLSAVLLAGGESRRMRQDKATIPVGGILLWHRQMTLLRSIHPLEIFVSARTDPPWRPADTLFVPDSTPSRGPLSGLTAALHQTRASHLLALAIDMPLMTGSHLRLLCSFVGPDCGVIPYLRGRAEPLAALYPKESLGGMMDALDGGQFGLQSVVRQLTAAGHLTPFVVSPADERLYTNVNSPADMLRLRGAEY